ncbi:MAG: hypothetical protein KC478_14145 [Bacteriovoracaceae bacterium]|nr:hypothetical protein [Bacteriovoracaceae bacterium]
MLNLSELPRRLFTTTFYKKAHLERGFIQAPLLTVDEFQESLLNGQVDTNTLLLFKDGKMLNSQYLSRATTSKISGRPSDRFWCMNKLIPLAKEDLLSLKVYNFSNFRKELKKVDNQLKAYFHTEVTSNVYFTPSNSQCFEPHSDPYNILIFQTSGQKHWKVWEDEDSPTKFTLEEGDMLILPKDMKHLAYTTNSHSLHITYGIKEIKAQEYLINIIRQAKTEAEFTPDMSLKKKQQNFEMMKKKLISKLQNFNPLDESILEQSLDMQYSAVPPIVLEGAIGCGFEPDKTFTTSSSEYYIDTSEDFLILRTQGYKFQLDKLEGLGEFIDTIFSGVFTLEIAIKKCSIDDVAATDLVNHLWDCGIIVYE